MDDLVRQLNDLCDAQPFQTGWYLKDLRRGREADRDGDVVVPSASTRKIAILMTAMEAVHQRDLALDQPVTIEARFQNNNSGVFQHLNPGFTIPFQDVLTMMIIVSDNTCTGTAAEMLTLDRINAFSRRAGMTGTTHRHGIPPNDLPVDHPVNNTNATTPNDVGRLLDLILRGATDPAVADRLGATPELCRLALDILSLQKLRARLPALLPLGTKVAHKTGTGARNYNDAGIIFQGEEPLFILSVYTERVPVELPDGTPGFAAANQLIAHLARACWNALRT